MTTSRAILLGTLLGLLVTIGYSCGTPTPVPDPPVPVPVGPFSGFHDCTLDSTSAQPMATTCGDLPDTAGCMQIYVDRGESPTALLCAARDVQVIGFREIAAGTAGADTEARARRLRAWLATTGATLRSTP